MKPVMNLMKVKEMIERARKDSSLKKVRIETEIALRMREYYENKIKAAEKEFPGISEYMRNH